VVPKEGSPSESKARFEVILEQRGSESLGKGIQVILRKGWGESMNYTKWYCHLTCGSVHWGDGVIPSEGESQHKGDGADWIKGWEVKGNVQEEKRSHQEREKILRSRDQIKGGMIQGWDPVTVKGEEKNRESSKVVEWFRVKGGQRSQEREGIQEEEERQRGGERDSEIAGESSGRHLHFPTSLPLIVFLFRVLVRSLRSRNHVRRRV
jgi:hypothetical protein